MIALTTKESKTETTAIYSAIKYSKEYPNHYITIASCFGLHIVIEKNMNVQTPDDSYFKWYVLNGKVKPFTKRQKINSQNATSWGN